MRKVFCALMLASAIWTLQGCGNAQNDSKENADSVNAAKDSVNKDSSSAAGPALTTEFDDARFATEAANSGMTEVELSKLAQEKATDPQLKSFAAMMVKHHGKANDELMALAKSKNITLPATLNTESQKKHDELAAKTGADFDKAYAQVMVKDHKETVDLFEDGIKNLKDPDLKAFVDKTLPTVKMHLEAIQKISDEKKY